MNKLSLFLIIATLIGYTHDTQAALRVWAIGDGVRVDPVSGNLIENMQTYFGPAVEGNPKEQNWIWNDATSTISLKAARNEVVACQIIVETDRKISGIDIKSADLTGPGGHKLVSSNVSLFRQWYHFVPRSAVHKGTQYPMKTGWYPDALIPFDAAVHGAPFNIPGEDFYSIDNSGEVDQKLLRQTNQAVWLDLYVPDETPTGIYQGTLQVMAGDNLARNLKVNLEVFDFTVPDEFHTSWELTEFHGVAQGPEALELKTYQLAQQHRATITSPGVMPDTIGGGYDVKLDWEKFDRRWGKLFDGSAFVEGPGKGQPLTHILLPFDAKVYRLDKTRRWWGKDWPFPLPGDSTGQVFTPEYEKAFIGKLVEYEDHFKKNGWTKTQMQFWPNGVDEPQTNKGIVGLKPLQMAENYGRMLERSGTSMIKYRLDIGSGIRSTVDLNGDGRIEPGTKEVVDYIQDVIDVWNCSGKWIETDILNMGPDEDRWDGVWFYNGYPPAVGSPQIIGESLGFRTWQWIVWKYKLSGVNDWEFAYPQGNNVFRQTIVKDSEGYPYLRNMYVYPGEQIGLEGEPLPSIRLKMIRRSQQDYEYFWMLTERSKDNGAAADKVVNRIVRRALRESVALWPDDIKDDPTNWSHRPGEWYDARLELADKILKAQLR
jgi:hypothetical protein